LAGIAKRVRGEGMCGISRELEKARGLRSIPSPFFSFKPNWTCD
jgi:hypothetical protein